MREIKRKTKHLVLGRIGGAVAIALDFHDCAGPSRFDPSRQYSFFPFFSLFCILLYVPILSGLLTLAICPYQKSELHWEPL